MKKNDTKRWKRWEIGLLSFLILLFLFFGFIPNLFAPRHSRLFLATSSCHVIAMMLNNYAAENGGHFPQGKTTTEIFQQIVDLGWCGPGYFYADLPGKIKPTTNKLKPENVGFDLTLTTDPSPPDDLPLVFVTGYKVTYQAGASAIRISPEAPSPTWVDSFLQRDVLPLPMVFANEKGFVNQLASSSDGTIPNFIPTDFDPKGKTYRQLTP